MIASFSDTHTLPEATQKQGINIFLSLFHFTVTLIYCSASIGMLISLYIHTLNLKVCPSICLSIQLVIIHIIMSALYKYFINCSSVDFVILIKTFPCHYKKPIHYMTDLHLYSTFSAIKWLIHHTPTVFVPLPLMMQVPTVTLFSHTWTCNTKPIICIESPLVA